MLHLFWFFYTINGAFAGIPFFLSSNRRTLDLNSFIKSQSVTPAACSNFYEYSCSKWKANNTKPDFELSWNHFTVASYEIKKKIQRILESPIEAEYPQLLYAQRFYNACIQFDDFKNRYVTDLKLLIDYFKGWPIIELNWDVETYNWLEEVALITRKLGFHPIVKFHVGIDYKNTEKYVLYIEPGNLVFPQNILLDPIQYSNELLAYEKWISQNILYLFFKKGFPRNINGEVKKIIDFERKLSKFMSVKSKVERNTAHYFSKKLNINFVKIFQILFSDLRDEIKLPEMIVIRDYDYFKNVMAFMRRISHRKVANYLIWTIVKEFSRDTSAHMQKLNFSIDRAVLGISLDMSREIECTNKAMDYFSFAILPKYLRFYFKNNTLESVRKIADNIKNEFVNLLKQNSWMSNRTKALAIEKIKKIQCIVGYSEWMNDKAELEKYYDESTITNDHLKNLIILKQRKMKLNLSFVGKAVKTPLWPSNIFDVNAYYSILQNLVFVPLGILQEPFYHENGPRIFNYGALGSLIGHEFSHALDTSGRQANSNGNIVKWWPKEDISSYQLKSKCFQMNKYRPMDLLLIGENIADNVGLEISYKAYRNLKHVELEDVFWNFQNEEIFFLSYAQMWCEISNQPDFYSDEHGSVEARVNQAVLNNDNFNQLFSCTKNNSQISSICKLW